MAYKIMYEYEHTLNRTNRRFETNSGTVQSIVISLYH